MYLYGPTHITRLFLLSRRSNIIALGDIHDFLKFRRQSYNKGPPCLVEKIEYLNQNEHSIWQWKILSNISMTSTYKF